MFRKKTSAVPTPAMSFEIVEGGNPLDKKVTIKVTNRDTYHRAFTPPTFSRVETGAPGLEIFTREVGTASLVDIKTILDGWISSEIARVHLPSLKRGVRVIVQELASCTTKDAS